MNQPDQRTGREFSAQAGEGAGEGAGEDAGEDAGEFAALLLACPRVDLESALLLCSSHGQALLPAGDVGDLGQSNAEALLLIVEINEAGPHPAATWRARLLNSTPLRDPDPADLVPPSWSARHEHAFTAARQKQNFATSPADKPADLDEWNDEDEEPKPTQMFLPITALVELPKASWIFTNELVRKQSRGGRRFAPRAPTLIRVTL